MIFFDQYIVSSVKLEKWLTEFLKLIALELAFKNFVTIIEVKSMRRCSRKANKLRYIDTIRGAPREIAIKKRKKLLFQNQNHPVYIIYCTRNYTRTKKNN